MMTDKFVWWATVLRRNPPLCTYDYEPERDQTLPCSERYRASCGCRQDGKPSPRRKWRRYRP